MKKIKKLIIPCLLPLLAGCATHSTGCQYIAARPINTEMPFVSVPASDMHYQLTIGNDSALNKAFNEYLKKGKAPNIITSGFVKFAYNAAQQPIIRATPFQETVISLEPGEHFTNVSSGDPNRWSYTMAASGSGETLQQNILLKPSLPNISTNMVITTDKRIYNLKLVSTLEGSYTTSVSFWYPDELVQSVNAQIAKNNDDPSVATVPDVSLNNLHFNYCLSTKSIFKAMPSWNPVRVFDDGTHTFIQFKADIDNKDMPVLFILNGSDKELVNYRVKAPYFVVDKIFKEAVLVMGVGSSQSSVFITNQQYAKE